MEIIQLSLPSGNFYNPATGELIVDAINGINTPSKSLKGVWNHEILESPDLFDEELVKAWNIHYEAFIASEEDSQVGVYMYSDYEAMLEKFLTHFDNDDWAAFKVISTQFGCGPSADINWYILEI